MIDHEEEGQPQEGRDRRQSEKRGEQDNASPPFNGHPPIIIPDGGVNFVSFDRGDASSARPHEDIVVEFDAVTRTEEHYQAGITGLVFTGSGLKKILHVKVRTEQGWHTCLDSPRNCRIFVSERHRQTGNVRHIEIDATSDNVIDIHFPGDYRDETTGSRKKMRGPLKKVRSLIILDRDGRLLHDCLEVRENRNCLICICDDCEIPCGE